MGLLHTRGQPPSNVSHSGGWTVSVGASGGGFCATTERLPNLVDGFAAKLTAGPAMAALRLAAGGPTTLKSDCDGFTPRFGRAQQSFIE
jgi:hypothetical protein